MYNPAYLDGISVVSKVHGNRYSFDKQTEECQNDLLSILDSVCSYSIESSTSMFIIPIKSRSLLLSKVLHKGS